MARVVRAPNAGRRRAADRTPHAVGGSREYACARAWSALAEVHALVTERLEAALATAGGLGINDFDALLRLDQAPPPGLRLSELNRSVRLSQPALSRMTGRLEQQGLLRRAGDPQDRRGVLLAITPAGRRALRRAIPVHARCVGEVLVDRLTPAEHDLLAGALTRVATSHRDDAAAHP